MIRGIVLGKSFWVVNTWRAPARKRLTQSTLNFTHTFLTDCFTKPFPRFSYKWVLIFYCNNSTRFESVFCMKTVKCRFFEKHFKRRKLRVRFCLYLGWLHISEKKIENCNSVGAGAHKVGKVASFWPNFDPNFTDICRA